MFVCVVRVFAGSVVGVVERSLVGMKLSGSYFVEVVFITSACFWRSPPEISMEYLIMKSVRNCLSVVVVVVVFCVGGEGGAVGVGVEGVAAFA